MKIPVQNSENFFNKKIIPSVSWCFVVIKRQHQTLIKPGTIYLVEGKTGNVIKSWHVVKRVINHTVLCPSQRADNAYISVYLIFIRDVLNVVSLRSGLCPPWKSNRPYVAKYMYTARQKFLVFPSRFNLINKMYTSINKMSSIYVQLTLNTQLFIISCTILHFYTNKDFL